MTRIRTTTQLVAVLVLAVVGALLIAEVTDLTSGEWRNVISRNIDSFAAPTWPGWQSAIIGIGLAVLGVTLTAAQFAPEKRGLTTMHEVHRSPDGTTRIAGRAAIAAARHELEQIEGVVAASNTIAKRVLTAEIQVDDRADLDVVEREARARLDTAFWIDLGLADMALDIIVVHHPDPPRVR